MRTLDFWGVSEREPLPSCVIAFFNGVGLFAVFWSLCGVVAVFGGVRVRFVFFAGVDEADPVREGVSEIELLPARFTPATLFERERSRNA